MRLTALVLVLLVLAPSAPAIPTSPTTPTPLASPALELLAFRETTNLMDVARNVQAAREAGAGAFSAEADVRLGVPTGDMTGDGRDDILVANQLPTGLSALRGHDGAPLWSIEFEDVDDYIVWPTTDITGDARADAVVETFTLTSNTAAGVCNTFTCVVYASWVFHWDVLVVSGADGSIAWSKTYPGFERLLYAQGIATVQAENVTVLVEPGERVIVNSYDALVMPGLVLVDSHGEALSGEDGTVALARRVEARPDFGILFQAGRDGSLAWEVDENAFLPGTCLALALDACTTQTAITIETETWSYRREAIGYVFAFAANADLSGDGEDDLILVEILPGESRDRVGAVALGALLWFGHEGIPLVLGDGNGDGAADLALVEVFPHEYNAPYAIHRVSGATGIEWLVTRPDFVRVANAATGLSLVADHDGDGARDAVWLHLSLESEYREQLLVESGATGATILEQDAAGIRPVFATGDLDDDGLPDLVALTLGFSFDPDDSTFVLDAQAMRADGTPLWSWTESYPQLPGLYIQSGGDVAGSSGDDLVFTTITTQSGDVRSRIQTLDGATGAPTWTSGELA